MRGYSRAPATQVQLPAITLRRMQPCAQLQVAQRWPARAQKLAARCSTAVVRVLRHERHENTTFSDHALRICLWHAPAPLPEPAAPVTERDSRAQLRRSACKRIHWRTCCTAPDSALPRVTERDFRALNRVERLNRLRTLTVNHFRVHLVWRLAWTSRPQLCLA